MAESTRSDWTATNICYLALMTFDDICLHYFVKLLIFSSTQPVKKLFEKLQKLRSNKKVNQTKIFFSFDHNFNFCLFGLTTIECHKIIEFLVFVQKMLSFLVD